MILQDDFRHAQISGRGVCQKWLASQGQPLLRNAENHTFKFLLYQHYCQLVLHFEYLFAGLAIHYSSLPSNAEENKNLYFKGFS